MRLFAQDGYDRTTMRAIAEGAGVSLGNAYYYFSSKEHLIQGFYDRMQVEHQAVAAEVVAGTTSFAERLAGVMGSFVDVAAGYHQFAGAFFKNAAEPTSPLSPFSPESQPARDASIELFRTVVAGSDIKAPAAVQRELPELLWLLHMGMVLFWVHDRSEDQQRTRQLITSTAPLVDKLVRMTRLPGVRGVVVDLMDVVRELKG